MSTIKVGENENLESALRRFKRKCSRDGIIGDLRKKEFYEKPSVKRSRKPREKEIRTNEESVTRVTDFLMRNLSKQKERSEALWNVR